MSKNKQTPMQRGLALGFSRQHARLLAKLSTPEKIQDFLDRMPINHEIDDETCLTAAGALKLGAAHCIEGAMIAASALYMHGEPPLLLDFQSSGDDDHVVTLFKRNGCWGAISKSNHLALRWRDPVFRNLRELAMSYFHEYALGKKKTLRTYSRPFDLDRYEAAAWATGEDCWGVAWDLDKSRHYQLLTPPQKKSLRDRDRFELSMEDYVEYPAPKQRKTKRP